MATRPLVPTTVRTEFGEVLEDGEFYGSVQRMDLSYVAGYSDIRRARDLAKGLETLERTPAPDDEQGEQWTERLKQTRQEIQRSLANADIALPQNFQAKDVPTLPVRLEWVRTAKVSGSPDSLKQVQYSINGYRQATKADVGKPWLKALPAGASEGVGGAIHQGDTVLMVCDDKRAARNAAQIRRQVDAMTKTAAAGDLMRLGETFKGSEPTFVSEPGREIKAPPSAIKSK